MIAIVFLLFTVSMLHEQYDAVKSNISKIARLIIQRDGANEITEELERVSSTFNEIFGGETHQFAWHWLFPIPIRFPDGMHDQVMGYTWDPPPDGAAGSEQEPYRVPDFYIDPEMAQESPSNSESGLKNRKPDDSIAVESQGTGTSPLEDHIVATSTEEIAKLIHTSYYEYDSSISNTIST